MCVAFMKKTKPNHNKKHKQTKNHKLTSKNEQHQTAPPKQNWTEMVEFSFPSSIADVDSLF